MKKKLLILRIKKPEGWDSIPKEIVDPEAKKPEDWDEELDGAWEAPMIPNSEYKGEWRAKMIPNPAYKGEWVHPEIDNPDYKYDPAIYAYDSHGVLGIEIWQVKSGTIFDDFLITDSVEEAEKSAEKVLKRVEAEKNIKKKKKRKREKKTRKREKKKKPKQKKKNMMNTIIIMVLKNKLLKLLRLEKKCDAPDKEFGGLIAINCIPITL